MPALNFTNATTEEKDKLLAEMADVVAVNANKVRSIVSYCSSPIPCTYPVPLQCERATTEGGNVAEIAIFRHKKVKQNLIILTTLYVKPIFQLKWSVKINCPLSLEIMVQCGSLY